MVTVLIRASVGVCPPDLADVIGAGHFARACAQADQIADTAASIQSILEDLTSGEADRTLRGVLGGGFFFAGSIEREGGGRLTFRPRLTTPRVTNQRLGFIVGDLYKGAATPRPIGTGSTADALRYELRTGQSVYGTFHRTKAVEYSQALRKWLQANPNADYYDRLVANTLLKDLQAALRGQ